MSDVEREVRRGIPLCRPCQQQDIALLAVLDGVRSADCRGRRIRVRYDVRQTSLPTLESRLKEAGLLAAVTLGWRVKRAFYRYVDENIRTGSGHSNGEANCCSNPQGIYASRKRGR